MSVLSYPRIALNGSVTWNPATQNNSISFGYDKNDVDLVLSLLKFKDGTQVSLENYTDWLTELNANGTTNGDWNVFGQHQVVFDVDPTTAITGFDRGNGVTQTNTTDPVLKNSTLRFTGGSPKLVDVDAYASNTSQVFLSDFGIYADNDVGFRGAAEARMTSRRIFGARNMSPELHIAGGMGVVWQTTIAKDKIIWGSDAAASPVLQTMQSALDAGHAQGIMLRVCTYTTIYFTDMTAGAGWLEQSASDVYGALHDKYSATAPINVGNITAVLNPAKSTVLGAIGLWGNDEAATVPMNRVLSPTNVQKQLPLGASSALVQPDLGCVSLDLSNTIPATDPSNALADVGDLTVQATPSGGGAAVTLGTLPSSAYALTALNAAGGILDVPADLSSFTDDMALSIQFSGTKSDLTELVLAAEADNRSIYVNEGDRGEISVTVTRNGTPIPADEVDQYRVMAFLQPTDWGFAQQFVPPVPGGLLEITNDTGEVQSPSLSTHRIGSDSLASISIEAIEEGNVIVYFVAYAVADGTPSQTDALAIATSPAGGYAAVRIMPLDAEFEDVPADQLTWDYVYENALMPFDLTYRGMSCGVFDLGSKSQVLQHAETIAAFTAPSYFESPIYMPVTRDLSQGRRQLIVNYLVKEGALPTPDPTASARARATQYRQARFDQRLGRLRRRMRP